MAKFSVHRVHFGRRPDSEADDNGEGLPTPTRVKLAARRAAGESLHALCTARMDLTDVVNALLERLGRCDRLHVATLGYNARNLRTLLGWLDRQAVGQLTLLASIFFRSHNGELWGTTLEEFRSRTQRAACCHSHAKVVAMEFASGERLCIEGSSNLCGNGSAREQFALIHDAGLCDWHAGWIDALVTQHEGDAHDHPAAD
jgi:hypothetical protein